MAFYGAPPHIFPTKWSPVMAPWRDTGGRLSVLWIHATPTYWRVRPCSHTYKAALNTACQAGQWPAGRIRHNDRGIPMQGTRRPGNCEQNVHVFLNNGTHRTIHNFNKWPTGQSRVGGFHSIWSSNTCTKSCWVLNTSNILFGILQT